MRKVNADIQAKHQMMNQVVLAENETLSNQLVNLSQLQADSHKSVAREMQDKTDNIKRLINDFTKPIQKFAPLTQD